MPQQPPKGNFLIPRKFIFRNFPRNEFPVFFIKVELALLHKINRRQSHDRFAVQAQAVKYRHSSSGCRGTDKNIILVNQIFPDQRRYKTRAAANNNILSGLVFEVIHFLFNVAFGKNSIRTGRFNQRFCKNYLGTGFLFSV